LAWEARHRLHKTSASATLWNACGSDIRGWIDQHGGLTNNFIWMRAPDIYRFFKKC
jgi:hypothetical protein